MLSVILSGSYFDFWRRRKTMNKEFLDFIYDLRFRVVADIKRLEDKIKEPRYKCCDNMPDENELMAELRTRVSQLSSTDDIITKYLELAKKSK